MVVFMILGSICVGSNYRFVVILVVSLGGMSVEVED